MDVTRRRSLSTRVDPPHELWTRAASPSQLDGKSAATTIGCADVLDDPASLREQLRCQARQLANYFGTRQQQLDHREAELNARLAELDNEERRARLNCSEREAVLDSRETQLAKRERSLSDHSSRIAATEAYLEATRQDLNHREERLLDLVIQLDEREQQLVRQNDALAAAAATGEHQRSEIDREREAAFVAIELDRQAIAEQRAELEIAAARARADADRERSANSGAIERRTALSADHLAGWEINLIEAEARLAARERALEPRRLRLAARLKLARRRLNEKHQRLQRQLERHWRDCNRQRTTIRERYAELEALRDTVSAEQTELLHLRLAVQQLSADLARSLPGDAWQQALAEAREAIGSNYRRREARLGEREAVLRQLHQEIEVAHQRLRLERRQLADQTEVPRGHDAA
ncbi:MAG: hypothetical protein K2Y37_24515 [Pirellulales bacterium]|nr:hypothetical protein [Pirellulales bacterium]